jgi:hypothetical protein
MVYPTWCDSILDLLLLCFEVDDVQEVGYRFIDTPNVVHPESVALPDPVPAFPLPYSSIELPAVVFFHLSERRTDIYNCIKMLSDIKFGVNTQVIVQEKYGAQGDRLGQ